MTIYQSHSNKIKNIPELDTSLKYFSKEFYIMLFLLENEGARPYFTLNDIEKGTPLYRQQVDDGTDKLKEKGYIDKDKQCPKCGKKYKNRIPPICRDCLNKIFPEVDHQKKHQKWPNYIVKLNKESKSKIRADFEDLDEHIKRSI